MLRVLDWSIPILPNDKPRHFLGIGLIRDVFESVERGIDTFDCVVPTREARHGSIWTGEGRFDVTKGKYKNDNTSLEDGCCCPVCGSGGLKKRDIHSLFKAGDLLAGRMATIHNVFFFNDLMRKIRESIKKGEFSKFKESFLSRV